MTTEQLTAHAKALHAKMLAAGMTTETEAETATPRMDKLSSYRTTVANLDDALTVTYVKTPIVIATDLIVTLNSGCYRTVTTKRKMNQASNQFDLGYSVYQHAHEWYVVLPSGKIVEFEDGMSFAR